MGIFRGGRSEKPIRIPLPGRVDIRLGVYFSPPPGALPADADLRQQVLACLDRRPTGDESLRFAILDFVAQGLLSLNVFGGKLPPTPPAPMLGHFGLKESEQRRLLASTHCAMIHAEDLLSSPRIGLWSALSAADALVRSLDGIAFDPTAIHLFSAETGPRDLPPRGEIAVARHILVPHSVNERGLGWITTNGMAKFGLPNLEIRDAPPNLTRELGMLVNGAAQHLAIAAQRLADNALAGSPSANRSPALRVLSGGADAPRQLLLGPEIALGSRDLAASMDPAKAAAMAEEECGSAVARLEYSGKGRGGLEPFIAISAPRGFRGGHGAWLYETLHELLGSEDEVVNCAASDAALEEAHRRAVARLEEVKSRFQGGLRAGESLLVKLGFPHGDDSTEYMWVGINTWKGNRLQGQLANDPQHLHDLRAGDPIELDQQEVYDWVIRHQDGDYEGGFTIDVLRQRHGEG